VLAHVCHENGALRANIPEIGLVPLINEQSEKEKDRYEFSWCCSFSWGFGWLSAAEAKAAAGPAASRPDPEVVANQNDVPTQRNISNAFSKKLRAQQLQEVASAHFGDFDS
jgi:hypothetical protein